MLTVVTVIVVIVGAYCRCCDSGGGVAYCSYPDSGDMGRLL